jgi:hypothetical protein
MPSSGIEVSPQLNQQWNTLRKDGSTNYILMGIQNMESFVINQSGNSSDPCNAAQQFLTKEPAYILIRATDEKFYIVFFVPLGCRNAPKMVYSSSLNALKSGLGTDYLVSEVYITEINELVQLTLERSTHTIDRVAMMTQQEQLQFDAAYSTVGTLETESKMTSDLPVKVSTAAQEAIDAVKNKQAKTVALTLNTDTEELEVLTKGNQTPEQLQTELTLKTPSFIFFNYNSIDPNTQDENTTGFFVYYCPQGAPIKSKMFHSSAKAVVIKLFESHGLPRKAGFEADSVTDINTEAIMKTIYPPSQQSTRVAKPLPPHLRRKQQQQQ